MSYKCAEYNEKLEIQSSRITCLEYEINKNNSEFEKNITKFITAIQDLNSKNNLEKKIILKKSLFNLRRQRNSFLSNTYNQYFNEEYTDYEINKNMQSIFLLIEIR